MNLFDFFFPEQAQAAHLRTLSEREDFSERRERYEQASRKRRHAEIDRRFVSLEDQVGFLTLMLEAIIRKTEEKGVVSREELKALMSAIDAEDGKVDGKFQPK